MSKKFPMIITWSSAFSVGKNYLECPVLLLLALNVETKSLFTPSNLGSIKKLKYWFGAFWVVFFGSYLFQLIVRLNPDFSCCNSFALSVDKVITGT